MLIIETISTTLPLEALGVLVTDRVNYFDELLNQWGLHTNYLHHKSGSTHIVQIVTKPEAWEYLEAIGELN